MLRKQSARSSLSQRFHVLGTERPIIFLGLVQCHAICATGIVWVVELDIVVFPPTYLANFEGARWFLAKRNFAAARAVKEIGQSLLRNLSIWLSYQNAYQLTLCEEIDRTSEVNFHNLRCGRVHAQHGSAMTAAIHGNVAVLSVDVRIL
jgi:hypothetical protein